MTDSHAFCSALFSDSMSGEKDTCSTTELLRRRSRVKTVTYDFTKTHKLHAGKIQRDDGNNESLTCIAQVNQAGHKIIKDGVEWVIKAEKNLA